MSPETRMSRVNDPSPLQTDFAMQLSALGSIKGLQEDINMLAELMGGRKIALQAISREAGISVLRIEKIIGIPDTINFSMYINPFSGEPEDPSEFLPDPSADTATEAIDYTFNAGLKQVLEEVMHS